MPIGPGDFVEGVIVWLMPDGSVRGCLIAIVLAAVVLGLGIGIGYLANWFF